MTGQTRIAGAMSCRILSAVARALVVLVATALLSSTATGASRQETYVFKGEIGSRRVGMVLILEPGRTAIAGHYFEARRLVDIPVSGSLDDRGHLALRAPSGSFALRLVSRQAPPPTSFDAATGLTGTWHAGSTRVPVALTIDGMTPGVRARWYGDVTDASDASFEAMVQRFVSGALHRRRDQVAAAVAYPLRINGARPRTIRDRRALLAQWNEVFTPTVLAKLRAAMPHDMFVRNGQAMLGAGIVWFEAKGAVAINP